MEMIESRNTTSHIYKEEYADFLATKAVNKYYHLIDTIIKKLNPHD
jgi:hypothetical protein